LAVSYHLGYVPPERGGERNLPNRVATRMQRPIHTLAVSVRESCMDAGQSDKASILDWWNSHFDSGVRSGDG